MGIENEISETNIKINLIIKTNLIMRKLTIFFLLMIITMGSFAGRNRIFYFDSSEHGGEDFYVFYDETYLGSNYLNRDTAYFPTLIPGKVYLLKVTTDYTDVDSCFVSYDYVSESYEIDGFWIYANTGSLVEPSGMYGFYNINHDAVINYGDYIYEY